MTDDAPADVGIGCLTHKFTVARLGIGLFPTGEIEKGDAGGKHRLRKMLYHHLLRLELPPHSSQSDQTSTEKDHGGGFGGVSSATTFIFYDEPRLI